MKWNSKIKHVFNNTFTLHAMSCERIIHGHQIHGLAKTFNVIVYSKMKQLAKGRCCIVIN